MKSEISCAHQVFNWLKNHPNSTNREICEGLGLNVLVVGSRLSELKKRGLVVSSPSGKKGEGPVKLTYRVSTPNYVLKRKPTAVEPSTQAAPETRPQLDVGAAFELLVDMIADRVVARIKAARVITELRKEPAPSPVVTPEEQRALFAYDAAEARRNLKARSVQPDSAPDLRPGVLIIGLMPPQVVEVEGRFPGLNLSFLEARQAERRPYLRRAHTILMTKFITHGAQWKYDKAPNLQLCHGGVTELCKILNEIEVKV